MSAPGSEAAAPGIGSAIPEPKEVTKGKAKAALEGVDALLEEGATFWRTTVKRLAKTTKLQLSPERTEDLSEWLPALNAHVEAQFDRKKAWYAGVVTEIGTDDKMSVRFFTNVTEANLEPDKVRLLPASKTRPPQTKRYRTGSPVDTELKLGDSVTAPFEGNTPPGHEGYPGTIILLDTATGSADVNFKFNTNVTEHGIPFAKITRQVQMDEFLTKYMKAVTKVMAHKDARDFQKPVVELWPPESIPNYLVVVTRPMDLGTVKQNLQKGLYNGKAELVIDDTRLVFENCMTYTKGNSPEYYVLAEKMLAFVDSTFAALDRPSGGGGGGGTKRKASSDAHGQKAKRQVQQPPPATYQQPEFSLPEQTGDAPGQHGGAASTASEYGAQTHEQKLKTVTAQVMVMNTEKERQMEYTEMETLLEQIQDMPEDDQTTVLDIIKGVEHLAESDEIDLGSLKNSTMWKLRKFVDKMGSS